MIGQVAAPTRFSVQVPGGRLSSGFGQFAFLGEFRKGLCEVVQATTDKLHTGRRLQIKNHKSLVSKSIHCVVEFLFAVIRRMKRLTPRKNRADILFVRRAMT